jgi:hypothetical protein
MACCVKNELTLGLTIPSGILAILSVPRRVWQPSRNSERAIRPFCADTPFRSTGAVAYDSLLAFPKEHL